MIEVDLDAVNKLKRAALLELVPVAAAALFIVVFLVSVGVLWAAAVLAPVCFVAFFLAGAGWLYAGRPVAAIIVFTAHTAAAATGLWLLFRAIEQNIDCHPNCPGAPWLAVVLLVACVAISVASAYLLWPLSDVDAPGET